MVNRGVNSTRGAGRQREVPVSQKIATRSLLWCLFQADQVPARVNGQIKATEVRLVDEHGTGLGTYSLFDAPALAQSQDIDLVQIDPESVAPVCQVIDYAKYQLEVQERRKGRSSE